MLFKFFLRH